MYFLSKKVFLTLLLLLSLVLMVIFGMLPDSKERVESNKQFIRIGSGSISGVYYIAANSVCGFVKKSNRLTGSNLVCSVQSTPGAIYNLNTMRQGNVEVAAAQGDEEYKYFNGVDGHKIEGLRSLFNMYDEVFTVAVREDSSMETFDDLLNKRVNVGAPGSGVRSAMESIMKIKNWDRSNFQIASQLSTSEQAQALCDNKIDAMSVMMAAPNGVVQTAAATCGIRLIAIDEKDMNLLLERFPYYSKKITSGKAYGYDKDVLTFSTKAMFVTKEDVSDEAVYNIVKGVYNNFDTFKKTHPALEFLKRADMLPSSNASPVHNAAIKFYREAGLIE